MGALILPRAYSGAAPLGQAYYGDPYGSSASGLPAALISALANAVIVGTALIASPSGATAQVAAMERNVSVLRAARSDRTAPDADNEIDTTWRASFYGHAGSLAREVYKKVSVVAGSQTGLTHPVTEAPLVTDSTEGAPSIFPSVFERLTELSELMRDEGGALSIPSNRDFLAFLKAHNVVLRPSMAALDTGAVRALWKNKDREQVAIHFKGNQEANYVFFFLKDGQMKREYDHASLNEIAALLTSRNLWRLLNA